MEEKAAKTSIMGEAQVSAAKMRQHVLAINETASKYADLAETFLSEGEKEGVRGDIAFAQSVVETGYFRFRGDVKAEQNNYCGLGASGYSFDTPQLGIRA
ncbi:MAG: glucosaminidase domain-containing protein [Clostridiales bacterium]|nr:glucosaminidase domain-containing protein [Clostridiales bacterium]